VLAEFVGGFEHEGWKLAAAVTPIATSGVLPGWWRWAWSCCC